MSIWTDKNGRKHVGVMVNGKRVHRILAEGATASDAKLLEAELRKAITKSPKKIAIPGDPPMSMIITIYMQHSKSLADPGNAALRLVPWAEKYRASQVRDLTAHFIKDTVDAYAAATINRSLACLKKGMALAWKAELIPENYGLRIENLPVNNKREIFLTVEQVRDIAQHCTEQMQAVIWAALLTGARRGELVKLKAEFIAEDVLTFERKTTKTKRSRVVPIVSALRPWLKHFPLVVNEEGIKTAWQRARVKAGMEHVNFHDLRHSCASILLAHGVPLSTIGEILGHANTQTTQRYAHLQVAQKREALDKISALV